MEDDVIGRPAREALGLTKRQCTATNRAGERCGRAPIPGGYVCALHGAKAPQVQRAARQRLMAMVDPAFDVLDRALQSAPPCAACGRSDADRDPVALRAAQLVLDRAGFGPRASLEVIAEATTDSVKWARWLTTEQLSQIHVWIREAMERMAAATEPPVDGVLLETAEDAEVIQTCVPGETDEKTVDFTSWKEGHS